MEIGVSGQYEIYKNGELVGKTDNMVLDGWFTRFCSGATNAHGHAWLGSGTTAVAASDLGLETVIAGTWDYSGTGNTPRNEQRGSDWITFFRWQFDYSAASFTHSAITEVGFKMHTSSGEDGGGGTVTDSRALIRDVNGIPTSINKTSEDTLVVVFNFARQMPVHPVASEVSIGGVKRTMTFEIYNIHSTSAWLTISNLVIGDSGNGKQFLNAAKYRYSPTQELVGDAALGIGTLVVPSSSIPVIGVTSGVNWFKKTVSCALSASEMTAGIKYLGFGIHINAGGYFGHGVHFDPIITDSVPRTITFDLKITMVRGMELSGSLTSPLTAMSLPSTITEIDIPVGAFTSRGRAVATPIGGKTPYTYAWTRPGAAGTPALTADSPTSASTTFSATGASLNSSSEVWRCTITDDNGDTATADTTVSLTWAA